MVGHVLQSRSSKISRHFIQMQSKTPCFVGEVMAVAAWFVLGLDGASGSVHVMSAKGKTASSCWPSPTQVALYIYIGLGFKLVW
jgi:hypothetical protein